MGSQSKAVSHKEFDSDFEKEGNYLNNQGVIKVTPMGLIKTLSSKVMVSMVKSIITTIKLDKEIEMKVIGKLRMT